MTNQEAVKVLCEMLKEERKPEEMLALVQAIGALVDQSQKINTVTIPPTIYHRNPLKDWNIDGLQSNTDPCKYCSNNPKNGGSGICQCTIPYMNKITTSYSTLGIDEIRC